jgi:hypothetical protein
MIRPNLSGSDALDGQNPLSAGSLPEREEIPFDVNVATAETDGAALSEQVIHDEHAAVAAAPFVTRWNRLISQTNWEKGAIISQWRQELIAQGLPVGVYSDDAWSRSVEGVSAQHVGRLRRVYDRFKDSYQTYGGLYWTHFLAALDWSDAELWLEGAVQSRWSVAEMRRTRWEATGQDPQQHPQANQVVAADADEDFVPLAEAEEQAEMDRESEDRIGTTGPLAEGPDFGEGESTGETAVAEVEYEDADDEEPRRPAVAEESPFADLPPLPADIADAMELFKLAIVRHRLAEWSEITPATVQQVLDALGAFARADG